MGVIIEEVEIFFRLKKNPWGLWGVFHGGTDTLPLPVIITGRSFSTGGVEGR